MPVFFRAGCNTGGCHGAAIGKDGFHLSLFGYDPAGDYYRLTQQIPGRRIDLAVPSPIPPPPQSHRHGPPLRRQAASRPIANYYHTLLTWIQAGAPDDAENVPHVTGISLVPDKFVFTGKQKTKPLQVIAKYSDGTTRVVNNLALYLTNNKTTADIDDKGVVTAGKQRRHLRLRPLRQIHHRRRNHRPAPRQVLQVAQDSPRTTTSIRSVDAKLKYLRIIPSAVCIDDETFLRRAYLDLIGLPPTPDEYKTFLKDHDKDKRAILVDELTQPSRVRRPLGHQMGRDP